jgi:outer membrane protein assembly factor BamB
MIYTFPKHCLCFPMLDGNACLAPADPHSPQESHPLVRGPAWPAPSAPSAGGTTDNRFPLRVGSETQPTAQPTASAAPGDWPTFRHDEYRSAGTRETVGTQLSERWNVKVPGPDYTDPLAAEWLDNPYTAGAISAPVVAGGLVFVSQADMHRLIALDARDGLQRWQFVASGRLDGPPTIHRGQCLIGCRDGWVYNLRAADGQLIWKLRIAPHDRRISVYGQLESPCPVAGSVLVVEGLGYVSAGLHPQADGGVRVVCFRPETGQIVWQQPFTDLGFASPWPDPYEPRRTRPDSDPWRCVRPLEYRHFDLPVRDGDSIAVSRCLFDRKTGAQDLRKASGFYQISETGAYLPRTAWRYNDTRMRSPIAVAGGSAVYSTIPGTSKLFRVDFRTEQAFNTDWVQVPLEDDRAGLANATAKLAQAGSRWTVNTAANRAHFHRAMLVAGRHLFIAAPNGQLLVYDTETGQQVNEMKLPQAAWDGLAAAHGCLYVSTADGQVVCLAPPRDSAKP